jgi:hypothetical protein
VSRRLSVVAPEAAFVTQKAAGANGAFASGRDFPPQFRGQVFRQAPAEQSAFFDFSCSLAEPERL